MDTFDCPQATCARQLATRMVGMDASALPPEAIYWSKIGLLDTVGGTLACALDYGNAINTRFSHASATMVPALLARKGFTANEPAFEQRQGFFNPFYGAGNDDAARALDSGGAPLTCADLLLCADMEAAAAEDVFARWAALETQASVRI